VKVDDRSWFLALIDPANDFGAGVGKVIEVDLDVDLVTVPLVWLYVRLRRREAAEDAQKGERKKCCLTLLHQTPTES
jgi:hypothetical protein